MQLYKFVVNLQYGLKMTVQKDISNFNKSEQQNAVNNGVLKVWHRLEYDVHLFWNKKNWQIILDRFNYVF